MSKPSSQDDMEIGLELSGALKNLRDCLGFGYYKGKNSRVPK